jgi:hypothetical protein
LAERAVIKRRIALFRLNDLAVMTLAGREAMDLFGATAFGRPTESWGYEADYADARQIIDLMLPRASTADKELHLEILRMRAAKFLAKSLSGHFMRQV